MSDLQRVTGQLCDKEQNDQPQRMTCGRRILLPSQGGKKKASKDASLSSTSYLEGGVLKHKSWASLSSPFLGSENRKK